MNSKKFSSRVKGFTLVEMIVVITIIAILAGIGSIIINGFQRDARMETNDNYAKMLYTGFQNQLIQCEIKQDQAFFDGNAQPGKTLKYAEVYFEAEETAISDTITLSLKYTDGVTQILYLQNDTTDTYYNTYVELVESIHNFMDTTFEGFAAIYIDYENYTVDSVIYVEPDLLDIDLDDYTTGIGQVMSDGFNGYADLHAWTTDTTKSFRMLNTSEDQMDCIEMTGIYFGAYPVADDFDTQPATV